MRKRKNALRKEYSRNTGRLRSSLFSLFLVALSVAALLWGTAYLRRQSTSENPVPIEGYEVNEKYEKALEALKGDEVTPAKVTRMRQVRGQKVNLTFDGMNELEVVQRILDILDEFDLHATFFVSGADARMYPETVRKIFDAGHEIGNHTLNANKALHKLSVEEITRDFFRAKELIYEATGEEPVYLRAYATEYTKDVLLAAGAAGYATIDDAEFFLNYQSFQNEEQAERYIDGIAYSSTVVIKLRGSLDEMEYVSPPALSVEPGPPSSVPQPVPSMEAPVEAIPTDAPRPEDERLLDVVRWVAAALNATGYSEESQALFTANNGVQAEPIAHIYTTERSVAYLFYGFGELEELDHLLESLQAIGAEGTFFITLEDVTERAEQIQKILDAGNSLGIAILPKTGLDFYKTYHYFDTVLTQMEERFGVKGVDCVIQPWGKPSEIMLQVVNAMGLRILAWNTHMPSNATKSFTNATEIIQTIFGERKYELHRGQMVFFQLGFSEGGNHILGDIVQRLEEERNIYSVTSVQKMLDNQEHIYPYPLAKEKVLPEVRDAIHPGQLIGDAFEQIKARYIGNRNIKSTYVLPGFSDEQIKQLDIQGLIENKENAVFLTFDDWGTDRSITNLLDVLDKHHVKATFYVLTQHVSSNPNLLRAIGEAGHDIASHSHTHIPLAQGPFIAEDGLHVYSEHSDEDLERISVDVQSSWHTLQGIVGDMVNEKGRPILTKTFRPPTMAISYGGVQLILDHGFDYVVNGFYSTHDYEAPSSEWLYQTLTTNLVPGAVIVMHMSAESRYTAETLDNIFTERRRLGFAVFFKKNHAAYQAIQQYMLEHAGVKRLVEGDPIITTQMKAVGWENLTFQRISDFLVLEKNP